MAGIITAAGIAAAGSLAGAGISAAGASAGAAQQSKIANSKWHIFVICTTKAQAISIRI